MDVRTTALVLVCATVLVALGHLSGEAWAGLVVGTVLPSPVAALARRSNDA